VIQSRAIQSHAFGSDPSGAADELADGSIHHTAGISDPTNPTIPTDDGIPTSATIDGDSGVNLRSSEAASLSLTGSDSTRASRVDTLSEQDQQKSDHQKSDQQKSDGGSKSDGKSEAEGSGSESVSVRNFGFSPLKTSNEFGVPMKVRAFEIDQYSVVNNAVYVQYLQHGTPLLARVYSGYVHRTKCGKRQPGALELTAEHSVCICTNTGYC
jgi:hypothetical protein